jgi:hypothetical protein
MNFTPVSQGLFPNSSIWNRDDEFVMEKVKKRETKVEERQEYLLCRPWSPLKNV